MDFELKREDTPQLAAFRAEVRAFLEQELGGQTFSWSANWTTREDETEYTFRRVLGRKIGARGWLFPSFPEEYGGAGLTGDHHTIVDAELDRYGLSIYTVYYTLANIVAPVMLKWATEEQKRQLLPPMTRGQSVVWQVLTEPQGGSDVANCLTTAIRNGDAYVVNGQKTMVGSRHHPDFLWTLVCTNPRGKRHENLGWLQIPTDIPGITIQPLPMMMGSKNTIFFDNVRVPACNLVGGENNGWAVSSTHMELEHGGAGGIAVDQAVERLVGFCQTTRRHGKPLIEDPEVRAVLADTLIETNSVRLINMRNYWHRMARKPHPYGGVQFRYYNRMVRLRNARRLQEIVGFGSLIPDLAVNEMADFEHLARSGPGQLHGGGTLDTDRLIFARRLGLGRAVKEEAPTTI